MDIGSHGIVGWTCNLEQPETHDFKLDWPWELRNKRIRGEKLFRTVQSRKSLQIRLAPAVRTINIRVRSWKPSRIIAHSAAT